MDQLGYACINNTLRSENPPIHTGRSIIKRNFSLEKVSNLILNNVHDLYTILKWNEDNNIKVFRISSDLFPLKNFLLYNLQDLPDYDMIRFKLYEIKEYIRENEHIISMHPSQFVVLSSPEDNVVKRSIQDLDVHNEILSFLEDDTRYKINIHMGGFYDKDYKTISKRFISNYNKLSLDLQKRIIIENDDKEKGWNVKRIYDYVYSEAGIPITYDYHHAFFSKEKNMSFKKEYKLAKSTWEKKTPNEVHYSESNGGANARHHSEYIYKKIPDFILNDSNYIIIEAKQKEMALLEYRKRFQK